MPELYPSLQFFTFFVFFFGLTAYAALDGFDLGVGNLMLLSKGDHDRRVLLNAIGPVWDGNSVWIVISTGVLFAGFPKAFATLMTAFYLPLTFLMVGFMLRAMAIEFRSKMPQTWWRSTFDVVFCVSSLTVTSVLGLIIGNLIQGIPIDLQGNLVGPIHLFNPYAVIVCVLNILLFSLHGAIYLSLKTEGALRTQVKRWVAILVYLFIIWWVITTLFTALWQPQMMTRFVEHPLLGLFAAAAIVGIFFIPAAERSERYGVAFAASCLSIALLITLVGIGLYPNIVPSTIDPEFTLSIFNSSSGMITLSTIALVVAGGLPLSVFYLSYLYRVFSGTVHITDASY